MLYISISFYMYTFQLNEDLFIHSYRKISVYLQGAGITKEIFSVCDLPQITDYVLVFFGCFVLCALSLKHKMG